MTMGNMPYVQILGLLLINWNDVLYAEYLSKLFLNVCYMFSALDLNAVKIMTVRQAFG